MKKKETYQGVLWVRTAEEWQVFIERYDAISGNIYMRGCTGLTSVSFPKEVSGYISMDGCTGLTSVSFPKKMSGYIYMDDRCSGRLLAVQHEKILYHINDVLFPKPFFDSIRKGTLSAAEVFTIENMEQRRVAYERMDKAKMLELPNLKVLHEVADDGHGYPMRVISFTVSGYDTPFRFLNCHCPTEGREYFLETKQDTCDEAKAHSFGFDKITFDEEW